MKDPVSEVREVSEVSDVHLEMPRHGLRSTQLTPSPDLLPLLERVAINKNVIISVFDFAFLPQFYSFYHSSLLPLHITNFIAFAMDKRTYKVDVSLSLFRTRHYKIGGFHPFSSNWIFPLVLRVPLTTVPMPLQRKRI